MWLNDLLILAQSATPAAVATPAAASTPAAVMTPAVVATPLASATPVVDLTPIAGATPFADSTPIPLQTELLNQGTHMGTAQGVMLAIYAIVCIGLVLCVLSQTSKSEGLMQQMMGGAAPTYKGKKSADDNLATATNVMAFLFIAMSVLMCLVFRS